MKSNSIEIQNIIADFFKIYNSGIDSYNPLIHQTINDKYTVIDKSMLALFLYLKIFEKLNIQDKEIYQVLKNCLLKQIIYSETGNLSLEISNSAKKETYNTFLNSFIAEKFSAKNQILACLKYDYHEISHNKYQSLLDFCEDIADFLIFTKLKRRGNNETENYLIKLKNKFTEQYSKSPAQDIISKEQNSILKSIIDNKFQDTVYYSLAEVVLNLKDVYRYSSLTTIVKENVLFHTYIVTIISIVLADYLNSQLNEDVNLSLLISKALFHDFGEFKGNEIVAQVKYYNATTAHIFHDIERIDEEELESKVGPLLYQVIIHSKEGKEGYIYDLVDKILGIMKIWLEVEYMHNMTYLKAICSVYQNRLKTYKDEKRTKDIINKEFLLDLLYESYIYIKENLLTKNKEILKTYFTESEIKSFTKEIKYLTENKASFLE